MTTLRPRGPLASAAFAASLSLALPAAAQDMPGMAPPAKPAATKPPPSTDMPMDMPMDHDMPGMGHAAAPQTEASKPAPAPMAMPGMSHGMTSAIGAYPMSRDGSGTSWEPDASPHEGVHAMAGGWMTMSHALINLVYDKQDGPRGGDKAYVSGMIMTMAQRPLGDGVLGLKAMLSPDPVMGKSGYPLLLASGETADGRTALIDRQHPHDLFMELSASYSRPIDAKSSFYVYAGLPGEPAFGPPAFMHRTSTLDSPEAPIGHHWLDSTHITYGVLTGGYVRGDWKVEASVFRGREPDQHRWDIETGALDSQAARLSWNPTPNLALQASWAWIKSPEQLEPGIDEQRFSASALYTLTFGEGGVWATTLAAGRKDRTPGPALWAGLAETAVMPDDHWTLFARAERVEQDELGGGPISTVGKLSAGMIYDVRIAPHLKVGLGGLVSGFDIPVPLKAIYGDPQAGMVFLRFKLG